MTAVQDVFGHCPQQYIREASDLLLSNSHVGVEVELERMAGVEGSFHHWSVDTDGSLRDAGLEFKFKEPFFGKDVVAALEELETKVDVHVSRHNISPARLMDEDTSVHVHVDVRDLSDNQLRTFILLSLVLEQVLFSYAAPERENNIFSLSVAKANMEARGMGYIVAALDGGPDSSAIYDTVRGASKYASINLAAIHSFGSIEFRAHRGEYKAKRLLEWINILLSIKKAAVAEMFDADRLVDIVQQSPIGIVRSVFGGLSDKLITATTERDVMLGSKLLAEVLYIHNQSQDRGVSISDRTEDCLLRSYEGYDELFPAGEQTAAPELSASAEDMIQWYVTQGAAPARSATARVMEDGVRVQDFAAPVGRAWTQPAFVIDDLEEIE